MADSTGVTLTDTDIEVFSGRVLASYQHRDYFGEDLLMFTGQTAGEIINQPVILENSTGATNEPDGGDHEDVANITGVDIPLVDPIKSYSDILKTQVDVRPDLNLIENVGAQLGRDVAIGRNLRIANYLHGVAIAEGQTRSLILAGTGTDTGDAVQELIEIIAAEFDDNGIPDDQRYMFMKPTYFYALRSKPAVISSDFTQGQNINQAIGGNMSVLSYLNFTIRNMGSVFGTDWTATAPGAGKNLPNASSGTDMNVNQTTTVAVCWHTGSTMVRHQTGLQASIDWIQRQQVWMSIARLHMGIKTVKPEGVFSIVTV